MEAFIKKTINSQDDLPKESGNYFTNTYESRLSFMKDDIQNIEWWLDNVIWYLSPCPQTEELIKAYEVLVELCEAPQYHEIIQTKKLQKHVIEVLRKEVGI